jgi:2-polyprenyl-6-methoxyphenol hydroxylase-like FAD-dependent oxidoreductase
VSSNKELTTNLNPAIHYMENSTYISRFLNGKWTAVLNIKDNSPQLLKSENASDENVDELMKYVKSQSPLAANLFTRDEYAKYFSRSIFTGAVTKVSKLVIDSWAILLGDAAHSAMPATGEGINSALEDCLVLQTCLKDSKINNNLNDCLIEFEKMRLEDVNALSDMAYSVAKPKFKNTFQMMALSFLKKLNITGPTKEDMLFGTDSSVILKYSDVSKHWKEQTKYLGGPNVPI